MPQASRTSNATSERMPGEESRGDENVENDACRINEQSAVLGDSPQPFNKDDDSDGSQHDTGCRVPTMTTSQHAKTIDSFMVLPSDNEDDFVMFDESLEKKHDVVTSNWASSTTYPCSLTSSSLSRASRAALSNRRPPLAQDDTSESNTVILNAQDLRQIKYDVLGAISPGRTDRVGVATRVGDSLTAIAAVPRLDNDALTLQKFRQLEAVDDKKKDKGCNDLEEGNLWDHAVTPADVVNSPDHSLRSESSRSTRVAPIQVFAEAFVLGAANGISPLSLPLQSVEASAVDKQGISIQSISSEQNDATTKEKDEEAPESSTTLPPTATSTSSKHSWYWRIGGLVSMLFLLASGVAIGATCGSASGSACRRKPSLQSQPLDNAPITPSTITPAPTPPKSSVANFVNSMTMTGRTLLPQPFDKEGIHPEEMALHWLENDDKLPLQPDSQFNQSRLLQRYAVVTLWMLVDDNPLDTMLGHECRWDGVVCQNVTAAESSTSGSTPDLEVVTELHLVARGLKGSLSADLGFLSQLVRINAAENVLTGSIPSALGTAWTQLEYFTLYDNSLSGTLPSSIANWTALKEFSIEGNLFSSTLPNDIGRWTNLAYFGVSDSGMHGSLPESIGQWSLLTYFNAATNTMSGSFPDSIHQWTDLTVFDFDSAGFTGTLPLAQWTRLEYFNAEFNKLSGPFPASIANWTSIQLAYFYENAFTGVVPSGICDASNLTDLWADCKSEVKCECCTECH